MPPKSRERIGHLIQNPLLIVPVKGRVTGHRGRKRGERIAQEATKVYRAQVGTSEGDTRDIFQHLPGAAVQMGTAHRTVAEGFLRPFDMGLIRVFEDDLLRAVGRYTDQLDCLRCWQSRPRPRHQTPAHRGTYPCSNVATVSRLEREPSGPRRKRVSRRPNVSLT